MYAITNTGFRAISSASEINAGEIAVDALPSSLLVSIEAADLRAQRDVLLANCDWTQANDSPLDAATKAAWAAYRTALRNVPQQAGFPTAVNWPTSP